MVALCALKWLTYVLVFAFCEMNVGCMACIVHVQENLRQQARDKMMIKLVVIVMKTRTSFWNMSKASAPIHMTDTREK